MTQDLNPYRPPTAEVEMAPVAAEARPLAGKGRRFLTLVIDQVGYYTFSFVLGIVLALAGAGQAIQGMNRLQELLFGAVALSIYYLFFESLWGRTPGKLVMGTRVVDMHGGQPAFRDLVKRTLARLVPFEAFTFFGVRGFHDRISDTQVVYLR
jgi:uncharacterized RDD family membrane protein YckC